MTDELNDPASNYTLQPQQPAGMRIPEFVFRQLIGWGLKQIRDTIGKPQCVLDKLFAFVSATVLDQIKSWVLSHENIFMDVSFPRDASNLALVVVEPQGEDESVEDALLNDVLGTAHHQDGEVKQRGTPEKRTSVIYIGSNDERLTLFLYEIVKFIVLSNKSNLEKWYDLHNLTYSGQVLSFDEDKLPTFEYYRTMTLRYLTWFDFDGIEEASKVVDLDLTIDAGGLFTTVEQD